MPTLRSARPEDAAPCHAIERAAYPDQEAASLEKIQRRVALYPEGFIILEQGGRIAAFLNSGCTHRVNLASAALKDLEGHDRRAPHVVILSVAVNPDCQGQGYSRLLMEDFLRRMAARGKESVHLICKESLVPLYARFGFDYVQPSRADHGGARWHEMSLLLPTGPES